MSAPHLTGVYPGGGIAAGLNQFASFAIWYDCGLMIQPGAEPITITAKSLNPGLHADLLLTLVPDSILIAESAIDLAYGGGQIIFALDGVDFTGCNGLRFEVNGNSPMTGWSRITNLQGVPVPDGLKMARLFITVGTHTTIPEDDDGWPDT